MSISFIALKSGNTFWSDSMKDVISFGSVDSKQCHYALIIIKNTALIFEQQVFDNRTTAIISNFLRENLEMVLEYLNNIVSSPQAVAKETYIEAISAANHWCEYSTKTLIPHEGFITNIFALLNADPKVAVIHGQDMSKKVIKVVRKLLNKSKYAKLIENVMNI